MNEKIKAREDNDDKLSIIKSITVKTINEKEP